MPSDFKFLYSSTNFGVKDRQGPHQWPEKYNPTRSFFFRSSRFEEISFSLFKKFAPSKNLRPPSFTYNLNFSRASSAFFSSYSKASLDQGNPTYLFSYIILLASSLKISDPCPLTTIVNGSSIENTDFISFSTWEFSESLNQS